MPIAKLAGAEIYYEETGEGFPFVWSHEFRGDYCSWEPHVPYFAHRYRVITYNHRGYPPSSVPTGAEAYTQDILVEDLFQLLRHLGLSQVAMSTSSRVRPRRRRPIRRCWSGASATSTGNCRAT